MKTRLAIFTLFTFSFFIACNNQQATTEQAATPAPNQAELMKAAYREIVNAFETGVTDSLGKYVSENSVHHGEPVPGITSTGLQQLKDMIAFYRTSFSGIKMDYHHVVADGDMLIAHGSWSGNNIGPFMGMPATNKQINNVQYIDILRWKNGKFAEH